MLLCSLLITSLFNITLRQYHLSRAIVLNSTACNVSASLSCPHMFKATRIAYKTGRILLYHARIVNPQDKTAGRLKLPAIHLPFQTVWSELDASCVLLFTYIKKYTGRDLWLAVELVDERYFDITMK